MSSGADSLKQSGQVKQAWGMDSFGSAPRPTKRDPEREEAEGTTQFEPGRSGADWQSKYRDAMRRQQLAIKLLQGSDVKGALAEMCDHPDA